MMIMYPIGIHIFRKENLV